MTGRRRRKNDSDEPRPLLRGLPHYYLYPAMGFALGLGSPVGAFIMRYWLADPLLKELWVRHELQYNFLFYAYMAVGTVLAFVTFGYALGLKSEAQRVHNRVLSARIDELHLKSVTDSLTGAYTHGYLHELLEMEVQHSLTHKTPLSVLVLDVDDFKKINDSHGHLFGDRVLKELAETVLALVRGEDILGRMGGDEFVVIMPEADAATADHVARRVCASVAGNGYLSTVSVGTASITGHEAETSKELLARADANLYHAKRHGKNRVSAEHGKAAKA